MEAHAGGAAPGVVSLLEIEGIPRARQVIEATLAPFRPGERKALLSLLNALR